MIDQTERFLERTSDRMAELLTQEEDWQGVAKFLEELMDENGVIPQWLSPDYDSPSEWAQSVFLNNDLLYGNSALGNRIGTDFDLKGAENAEQLAVAFLL